MKVTFVALGQEQLAISLLSAVLRRAGHSTSLVFNPALFNDRYFFDIPSLASVFDRTREVIEEVVREKPDLLAFSVLTPMYRWSLEVAAAAKARLGVPVIFGGVHPSAAPDVCLENDCVDYVCVGEGEDAIVRLCDALGAREGRPRRPIPNLWWRDASGATVRGPASGFVQDLDSLPHWDKELWEDDIRLADNWMTMTSRGCPYRCTFCFNNFFAKLPGKGGGKYVRQRGVEHVMQELTEARRRWGIRRVAFEDDIFTVDKKWIRAFLDEYERELGLPFQCLVHPRYIDLEMARWLKDAGCQHVQMGVQSADEEYKRKQLLRMERDNHLKSALEALNAAGLDLKLDHMLGLPDEPRTAQEAARELYARYAPRRVQTYWLTHLPAVELTLDAVRKGHVSPEEYARIERGETRLYHSRAASQDHAEQAYYQRYELLFRAMPLMPRWLRERARAEHVPDLGSTATALAGFALEAAAFARKRDAEALNYAKHYAWQMARQAPEVALGAVRGATGARPAAQRRRTLPPTGTQRPPPLDIPAPPDAPEARAATG